MTPGTGAAGPWLRSARGASTEPGPDDPGDMSVSLLDGPQWLELQRSRGQMTPGTNSSPSLRPMSPWTLQRSRGQMTPGTVTRVIPLPCRCERFNGAGAR